MKLATLILFILVYITSNNLNAVRIDIIYVREKALKNAIMRNDIEDVRLILENNMKELNQSDKDGKTPLWLAAVLGSPEMIQYLLDQGAEVHTNELYELRKSLAFKQITPELLDQAKAKASTLTKSLTQLACLVSRRC